MILTVALLNGPFIACTTGKLPQQSQKLRKKLPACKTINLLPFPEGIFGASESSTGNHM
jgi:hypothetical protein